jgi:hypothetical protein
MTGAAYAGAWTQHILLADHMESIAVRTKTIYFKGRDKV